jgi:hypothetical protein
MRSLTVAMLTIAGIAISIPAVASPTVLGETHARWAQGGAVVAQYNDRASGLVGLNYKSKKSTSSKTSKKPKSDTTGQAKGTH